MNTKQLVWLVVTTILSSFIGGVFGSVTGFLWVASVL
ncbi:hypothetical protein PHYNN_195 [Pantoea phage Phynn]|nr:hypothetical protein PHYNN_195 [Pantoea phage Phynn]